MTLAEALEKYKFTENEYKIYKKYSLEFNSISGNLIELFNDPYGLHGLNHSKRVYILVNYIADIEKLNTDERQILNYCALYHDIGRTDDSSNEQHGIASFNKIIQNELINNHYRIIDIVKNIIENHCVEDDKANISRFADNLYKIFKDADSLDRVRISDLDTKYLRVECSKGIVNFAYLIFCKSCMEVLN